jgi:hypothetical protein
MYVYICIAETWGYRNVGVFVQVIPRKDLPQIHVMFVPHSKRPNSSSTTSSVAVTSFAERGPANSNIITSNNTSISTAMTRVEGSPNSDEDGDDSSQVSEGLGGVAGLRDLERTR